MVGGAGLTTRVGMCLGTHLAAMGAVSSSSRSREAFNCSRSLCCSSGRVGGDPFGIFLQLSYLIFDVQNWLCVFILFSPAASLWGHNARICAPTRPIWGGFVLLMAIHYGVHDKLTLALALTKHRHKHFPKCALSLRISGLYGHAMLLDLIGLPS